MIQSLQVQSRVAIITGGASGFGRAVATALSKGQNHQPWSVHLLDLNNETGNIVAESIGASFHHCDVTDYQALANTFHAIYQIEQRLDFVYANAGILERTDLYAVPETEGDNPPPQPDMLVVDINMKGVMSTCWLAMCYFRQTKMQKGISIEGDWEGNLVATASSAGLYPGYAFPMYTATKHAVVGFTRSIAPQCYTDLDVRVNIVCPHIVETGLSSFLYMPEPLMTPIENVVSMVLMFLDGKTFVDSDGVEVKEGNMYEQTMEVSMDKVRFKQKMELCDESLREVMRPDWRPTLKVQPPQ